MLPRTHHGWLVAALAAIFLAATSVDLAHRTAVDHVLCDEHGQLVHLHASPWATTDLPESFDGPSVAPRDLSGPPHDHCGLGPAYNERADLVPPAPALTLAPPAPRLLPAMRAGLPPASVAAGSESARGPPVRS